METNNSKVLLIYTGGTIGMIKDYQTGALRAFEFDNLYKRIPELSHLDCEISVHSFEKVIDSSDMNPQHWIEIAEVIERDRFTTADRRFAHRCQREPHYLYTAGSPKRKW